METCQMMVSGDWSNTTARLPLVQALTAGVESMTNATNLPGLVNHCNIQGTCMLVEGGVSIRQTLAPASMKAIYLYNEKGGQAGWSHQGQLSYSVSCVV